MKLSRQYFATKTKIENIIEKTKQSSHSLFHLEIFSFYLIEQRMQIIFVEKNFFPPALHYYFHLIHQCVDKNLCQMNHRLYHYDIDFDIHFDKQRLPQHLNKLYHSSDKLIHLDGLIEMLTMMEKDVGKVKNKHLNQSDDDVSVDEMDKN